MATASLSGAPASGAGGSEPKRVETFAFDAVAAAASGGFDAATGTFRGHNPAARLPAETLPPPSNAFCLGLGVTGALRAMRTVVSQKKRRFKEDGFDLDLTLIHPRIIAMGFPSSGGEGLYRNPLPEVQRFFETRYAGRYRIYNLCSERCYDAGAFLGRVARYPFDDHNPPPLTLLPALCGDMAAWLGAHPDNVVAIHCKAGKGRTGLAISALLLHLGVKPNAEAALRYFGAKRTANRQGVTIPSQMRYVHYYEQILRHGYPVTYVYRVAHIRMRTVPAMDANGGCTPWFQLFSDGRLVFDWRAAAGGAKGLTRHRRCEPWVDFDLTAFDVRVAGNVKLQLLHESRPGAGGGAASGLALSLSRPGSKKFAHLWFHTGFVTRNYLLFTRGVIDKANKDKRGRFHPAFALELYLFRQGIALCDTAPGAPLPPPPVTPSAFSAGSGR